MSGTIKKQDNDKESLIHFTNIQMDFDKPPSIAQLKKFKVPEIDLQIDDKKIDIIANLPGSKLADINISLTQDSLVILSNNKKVSYYTDIKLPEPIIPQSAVARFKDGTLNFNVRKMDSKEPWSGLVQLEDKTKELKALKEKLSKFQEQYHTIQLDYQNLLVRSQREVENSIDSYKISMIERLLKNIDNFELALDSASKIKNKDTENIILGINLFLNDLKNMVKEEGVAEVETKDMMLNPNQHEVMECSETDKYPENTILQEYQKGYKYKNRIIRPSKVRVAIAPKEKRKDNRINLENNKKKNKDKPSNVVNK